MARGAGGIEVMDMAMQAAEKLENESYYELANYVRMLKREMDSAVEDMTELMRGSEQCTYCKYLSHDDECTRPMHEPGGMCWEWRGAQEVER